MATANEYFAWKDRPYPISSAIYLALRFHAHFDPSETHKWSRDDLNAIYKAFYWRNAWTNRYDQGFLTQIGTDIKEIKSWLKMRAQYDSSNQWAAEITKYLDKLIRRPLLTLDQLLDVLTDGIPIGALGKVLVLPMMANSSKDLLNESTSGASGLLWWEGTNRGLIQHKIGGQTGNMINATVPELFISGLPISTIQF